MRIFGVLALCLALCACGVAAPAPFKDDSWDFLLLSELWPEQECKHISPCTIPEGANYFTLHGLWPERADISYPADCGGASFDQSVMTELQDELNTWWPDFKDPGGMSFYQHEWKKHGTCAVKKGLDGLGNQSDYFKLALHLRERLNTTGVLAEAGIVPSTENTYTLNQIQSVISKTYGFFPLLYCSTEKGNKTAIWQIKYCVGTNLDFMDCPDNEVKRAEQTGGCNIEGMYLMPIVH